jgi:methylmalonyl-CoA mutase cobalamin-binding domain/chain
LKSQGYLWKEGRHLVIIPPEHIDILDTLSQAVVDGDEEGTMSWARKAVEGGVDPAMALDALTGGMKYVARGFVQEQLGLPEVLVAAVAMKSAMPIVEEGIRRTGKKVGVAGTIVMGTVHGDIHDIGKTIVATLLAAQGFEAIDLGANVAAEEFVWAVTKHRPDVLAMSALMTTTAAEPGKVINALKEEGIRDEVRVVVGGGAVTEKLAQRIGADGYGATAREAVTLVRELTAGKREK